MNIRTLNGFSLIENGFSLQYLSVCLFSRRGLTPPHRVKSISMATFTQDEIDFLRSHGNELCAKTWLGLWDPKRAVHQQEQRELMMDKYERKRYYLEPASPLKSLANAVNLKSSAPATNHTQNGHQNGYASIHLTPPAAQRTSANGLQKVANSSSNSSGKTSSSISRPHYNHQNNSQNNNHDAFGLGGGLSSLNSAGSTSTGALSDTSSCASNGFGADCDFVADFGSANIFDATSARSTGSPAVSSVSSVGSSNGYAKVQPIRAAHLQQQQQLQQQQHQQQLLNGNGHQGTENFADFDHAPIYNAVGKFPSLSPAFFLFHLISLLSLSKEAIFSTTFLKYDLSFRVYLILSNESFIHRSKPNCTCIER